MKRFIRLFGLFFVLAALIPSLAHAESVTLDFETLPGGGSPPFGLMLTTQYDPNIAFVPGIGGGGGASGGAMITHCHPEPGSQTLCTHARSGKSVIVGVPDRTDEFLIHPIAMDFGQLQSVVSMYLKYPLLQHRDTIIATVTAYDTNGNQVARDTQTFSSDADWRRFSVGSAAGPANIARVVVAAAPSRGGEPAYTQNGWILVDDVTFEGETPAAEMDTSAPLVTVTTPSDYVTEPSVAYTLTVVEDTQLARVWSELIRTDTGAVIRRSDICGPGITSCPPGSTGPSGFRQSRTVTVPSSGDYAIRVVAEDAAGNSSDDRTEFRAELPEEIRVTALRVEVNQSVQTGLLTVDRVGQTRASGSYIQPVAGKDTVVRYYLVGQGGTREDFGRQLHVTIWRRDGSTFSRTLGPNAGQRTVDVPAAPSSGSPEEYELLWEMRADLRRTLNFVLSAEMMEDAERIGLTLDGVTGQLQIPVRHPITLGVRTVQLRGRHVTLPLESEVEPVFNFLQAAFPVRDVQVPFRNRWLSIPVPPDETDPFAGPLFGRMLNVGDRQDCNRILAYMRSTYAGDSLPSGAPDYTVTLGFANSGFSDCAGLAYLSLPYGISYNDTNTAPHEIVHTLGVAHASNDHGEALGGGYEEWPYPHGHISPDATLHNVDSGYVFGIIARRDGSGDLDRWNLRLIDPCPVGSDLSRRIPCSVGERSEEHDFMSYGPWQRWTPGFFGGSNAWRWLSDITYERIYNRILDRSRTAGVTASAIGGDQTVVPAVFGESRAGGDGSMQLQETDESRAEALLIAGLIRPDGTATLLTPLLRKPMPVSSLKTVNDRGAYTLELRGFGSTPLLSRSFEVEKVADGKPGDEHFWLAVEYVEGADELVIRKGGQVLVRENASANPPTVRVTAPKGGETFSSGPVTVTWEASDPDNDDLTFLVQYSPDGGIRWESITTVLPGQPYKADFPVESVMPGTQGIIRVTASDGFNTAYDVSAPFSLGNEQEPAPGDGGLPRDIVGHWAQDAIRGLIDEQIVRGYADGTFRPDNAVTRAEFVTFLARAVGAVPGNYNDNFRDVHANDWHASAVALAVQNNWVTGYPDGSFRPNATISRQEAAVILGRVLKYGEYPQETGRFNDGNEIASWAAGQVGAITRSGIITGYPDGSFRPSGPITRAETAVIISRSLGELMAFHE